MKNNYCKDCQEKEHDCCSLEDNDCPCCNDTREKLKEDR
jgi:hypothetical protein